MHAVLFLGSEKADQVLSPMLSAAGFDSITRAQDASLDCSDAQVIVIDAPLPQTDAQELCVRMCRQSTAGVLFLSREACETAQNAGALVVRKPLSRPLFEQALTHALCVHRRLSSLGSENSRLRLRLDELKLIDRAKLLLMQHLSMSESQAHRYIEKQAMDLRVSRAEVARNILINYQR